MNLNEIYKKFACLMIEMVGLQKGQSLLIKTESIHTEIAMVIAEYAYKRGANYCKIEFELPELIKSRVNYSDAEFLNFCPKSEELLHIEYINEGWATIFLKGEEDPDLLSDISIEKKGLITQAYFDRISAYQKARLNNIIPWLIVVLPTPKWAAKVLNTEATQQAVLQMWEKLLPIYKLDEENPIQSWRIQAKKLNSICTALNHSAFETIKFVGPGTELTIALNKKARWLTTESQTVSGVKFYGNLPIEVFTTPDFRRTEGIVTVTRPVTVLNQRVEEACFEFKNGEIVHYNAASGKSALDELFRLDPAAKRLGEVALVDIDSPFYQSGLIFDNILLDEGAASHIALGGGIPPCINGASAFDDSEKRSNGINVSQFHIDFMIGSNEMDVFGRTKSNQIVKIMNKGMYCQSFISLLNPLL